jgi:hypothetical protein
MRYVLLEADFRAFCTFLRISHVLFNVQKPVQALHSFVVPLLLFFFPSGKTNAARIERKREKERKKAKKKCRFAQTCMSNDGLG